MQNNRVVNIVSAALAATFAIGSICIYECGSKDRIGLQSPSLLAPGSVDFYERQLMDDAEISETGVVTISLGNPNVSINDYTFKAVTSFSDVTVDYNNDPEDPVTYDGGTYWLKNNVSLVPVKNTAAAVDDTIEVKADAKKDTKTAEDKEIKLKIGDSLVRISHNKDWSLVRLADGTQGYVKNSDLSATVITPVPTNTPTPKPTNTPKPKPKKKNTPTPKPKKTNTSSSSTTTKNGVKETKVSKTVYATTSLNTRSGPGISYSLLSTIKEGTKISVVAETDNGWYKSSSGYYVKASYTTTKAPSSGSGSKATATPKPSNSSSTKVGDKSGDFAKYVKSFIGCKYVAGGSSPTKGFDCSGFVMYCFKNYYKISLPHGATMQSKKGKEVKKEDIQCGDIICFDRNGDGTMEHSAIYIGNDTYVHAKGAKYGVVSDKFSSAKNVAHIRRVL